jgi:D-alanyl-D-alanine carboxypeptidase
MPRRWGRSSFNAIVSVALIRADGTGDELGRLGAFRYQTRCGTVFGHTGNTFGYTQFMAASRDGSRSATVSINLQRTQTSTGDGAEVFRSLREAETLAVCAALADD